MTGRQMTGRPTFALLVLFAVCSISAAHAQDACQAVAKQIRAFSPPAWELDPPRTGVLALDRLPTGALHVTPGRALTRQEVVGVLRDEFQATPGILVHMETLSDIRTGRFILYRFEKSALYALELADGYSQFFSFFAVTPDGRADVTPESSAMTDTLRFSCNGPDRAARVGDVQGVPAFICQAGTDQDQKITIVQRQSAGWQDSCRLDLHLDAEFKIAEQFCDGINCKLASEQALLRIRQRDKQPFSSPFPDPASRQLWQSDKVQRMMQMALDAQIGQPADPPYFNHPDTKAPVYMSSRETFLEAFSLEGEIYIGRFGHAYSGWRASSDYLFALYRLAGDQLEPVAGFYVTKTLTAPLSVTVR
jgi:hypothetical protein